MATKTFETNIETINNVHLLRIPKKISQALPSRGMVLVSIAINGHAFISPLEPDGTGSHWLKVSPQLLEFSGSTPGQSVSVAITPASDWPEPLVPNDVILHLNYVAKANELWQKITPMARWDWLRWINATNSAKTRHHRITVAMSKLENGMRRPCCFNRSMCTDPTVSKSGVLL